LNVFIHPTNVTSLINLLAYLIVSFSAYIIIPFYLIGNNLIRDKVFKIIVSLTVLISFSVIWSSISSNFFGIPVSVKSGYSSFGIVSSGGILSHPLTAGTQIVLGIGISYYLYNKNRNLIYIAIIVFLLAALITTQARGAIFSLIMGILYFSLPKTVSRYGIAIMITIPVFILLTFTIIVPYLAKIDLINNYLRLQSNIFSYRDILWAYGIKLIINSPLIGYGFLQSSNQLAKSGLLDNIPSLSAGAPFHSTFIDNAVDSGLLATSIYILLFIIPIIRSRKYLPSGEQPKLIAAICFGVLISAIFINYNIGGVRSVSITIAILLGFANWSILLKKYPAFHLENQKTRGT